MPKTRKPKVLFVARDDGGCGFYRCLQPANFLNRSGLMDAEYVLRNVTKEQLMEADLVVMQDTGSVESTSMCNFMVANKIPFVTEYDDFIQHISPHNFAGYPAWNPSTLYVHRSMEMSRRAVGMTVSTEQLAREYFPYNNDIFVVPNYLDRDKWEQGVVRRNDGKIRIGWCGGNAHADDLLMISKVLDKIVKEYNGKVVFETMGMTRHELANVFPLKSYGEVCPSCGYEGEIHHYPGEALDDYPTVLASRGWDIAVAPVINTAFNNAKSDIKIKEYSAIGLPIVASPIAPYRKAAAEGASITFAETFEEWYNAIKELVESVEKREEMAHNNKEWVKNYWIQENIEKIAKVYEQILMRVIPILGSRENRMVEKNLLS